MGGKHYNQSSLAAAQRAVWERLQQCFDKGDIIEGVIIRCVRGGYIVEFSGVTGFLPGNQLDALPIADITPLLDRYSSFKILKCEPVHGQLVVSRRATLPNLKIREVDLQEHYYGGQRLPGIVKEVVPYAAFIDIGEVTGILPSRPDGLALQKGQALNVVVVSIDPRIQRVVLAIDHL